MNAGSSLGPYRIQEKLGESGMSEVCRALDPRLGREVAIEVLSRQLCLRPQPVGQVRARGVGLVVSERSHREHASSPSSRND